MLTRVVRLSTMARLAPRLTMVPRRFAGHHMTPQEIDAEDKMMGNHFDFAPIPSGDYKSQQSQRQLRLNTELILSFVFMCATTYYAYKMGSLDVGFPWEFPIPEHLVPDEIKNKYKK